MLLLNIYAITNYSELQIKKQISIASQSTTEEVHNDDGDDDDNDDGVKYRIMVIGITGAGKSSLCNFFFRENVFEEDCGQVSITASHSAHSHFVNGVLLEFIDTPGFSDEYESNESRLKELGAAIFHAKNGVHAIAICLNGHHRYTIADGTLFDDLDNLGTFWPHSFVVYTHGESMGGTEEDRKQKVTTWLKAQRCPKKLTKLFEVIENRYMVVESKCTEDDYYQQKCCEFISLVETIYVDINKNQCYSNKMFTWAKAMYEEKLEQYKQLLQTRELEIEECNVSIIDFKKKFQSAELMKKELSMDKEKLQNQLQIYNDEIKKLQSQMVENEKKLKSLHGKKVEKYKTRVEDCKMKLRLAEDQKLEAERNLEQNQESSNIIRKQCDEFKTKSENLQEEVSKKNTEIEAIREIIEEKNLFIDTLTTKNKDVIKGLEKQIEDLTSQVGELTKRKKRKCLIL